MNGQPWHIVPLVIGHNRHLLAKRLKGQGLFQDAYMTTIVAEEGSWGDHEDMPGRTAGFGRYRPGGWRRHYDSDLSLPLRPKNPKN